jgi:hypothetical protein
MGMNEKPFSFAFAGGARAPGRSARFQLRALSPAGAVSRPDVNARARDIAFAVGRTGARARRCRHGVGPWHPHLDPADLQIGLRHMLLTRLFDDRMQRMQRAGKISFYIRSLGEEAVSVAQCMALRPATCCFRPIAIRVCTSCAASAGGSHVSAAVEHPRHVQGAAAAGDVSLQAGQYFFDLGQSGDAISAGRGLGHGGGHQG